MWEKRVYRGNTYSAVVTTKSQDPLLKEKKSTTVRKIKPLQQVNKEK